MNALPRFVSTAILAIVAIVACPALAEVEFTPLVTDRPGASDGPTTVPAGSVQIESGYELSHFGQGDTSLDVAAFPSVVLRYGLAPKVELRLKWQGYVNEKLEIAGIDSDTSGSGGNSLGAKIYLSDELGSASQLALLFEAALPTGSAAFRGERIDPLAHLLGSHTLSDRLGFGWNIGVAATTVADAGGDQDTFAVGNYRASLGIGINDRWGSFVEFFGGIPLSGPEQPANSIDGGVTYLLRDDLQFDASAGAGLSDQADDWFVSLGLSFRLRR